MLRRNMKKNLSYCWYIKETCGFKNMFVKLDESESDDVTLRDASKIMVKGKGKILVRLKNGRHQFIECLLCA